MSDQKNLGHNSKKDFLKKRVEHIDITSFDSRKIISSMEKMSFVSRETANAANIFKPNSPLYMGFKVDLPNIQSKYKSEFYEMMNEMNEVQALMRLYQRNGDTEKAMRVYNKNKNLLMWRSTYNKVNSQLQAISRQIKFIEAQKNMTEGEKLDKVRQLNLLKNEIVKTLKERVLAFEKNNDTRVKRQIWWK